MKKILFFILISILVLIFCGCVATNENAIPRISLIRSHLAADNIYIAIRDNYNFNIQRLYEEKDTEDGYDIIIHIIQTEEKEL